MILWSNILIPVASMVITVFATIYTVSKRVENENREKHKPYLTLNNIEPLDKIDEYKYYLTVFDKNKLEIDNNISKEQTENSEKNKYMSVIILLNNIGYGVASNIRFYNLSTGELITGAQSSSKDKNQKLFTTFDIAINSEKQIQMKIVNLNNQNQYKILCIYQDLNGNIYDFIISINIKSEKAYDFFAYQRTSHSYAEWIKDNKTQYKQIIKQYKK